MKHTIHLLCALTFTFIISSCQDKVQVGRYSNGTMKSKMELIDSDLELYKVTEWYADSTLKWSGKMKKGDRVKSLDDRGPKCWLDAKGDPSVFKIDSLYLIRIRIDGVHPDDYNLFGTKCVVKRIENDTYDYSMMPSDTSIIGLKVKVVTPEGIFKICDFGLPSSN